MHFICVFLIGLFAVSSMSAAQNLPNRGGGGLSKPSGPSIGSKRPSTGPRAPGIGLSGPSIIIGPNIGKRKCPENTTGKWPNCRSIVKNCPKGTTGKWPDCIKMAKPGVKACPEGQVRKGKVCVQVTEGGSGKAAPPKQPPKAAAKKQPAPVPPTIAALTAGRPHRPREILVLVDADKADDVAARLAREHNVSAEPPMPVPLLDGAIVQLRLRSGQSLEALLAAISTDPDVELAQPNYDYRASKKAALPKGAPQYANETIRLEEAHRLARGQGVMIAVIDTAIDGTHPEIADAIAGTFDAVGNGPALPERHGTEIAGILAARSQLTGVAPEVKLLSVRAFTGGKTKLAQSTSLQLLKGIDWAHEAGAKIMNMSFTGPMDPLLERIIKTLAEKGVIVIAAAGNDGPKAPPVYPAAYPDVIAVTATDAADKPYGKANRGNYISLAAPGVNIVVPTLKGRYDIASGTSMAAAHVSGVAALLIERNGELSADEVRTILSSSARKPSEQMSEETVGAGIVDAAGAVAYREKISANP